MPCKLLFNKIEKLRARLNKLIERYGTSSKQVLKCSQELDTLIHSSYITKNK